MCGTGIQSHMVTVHVTHHLQREGFEGPWQVAPGSLRQVLDALFQSEPRLRSYVVDDQGRIRKHVAVFLDGEALTDREHQQVPVPGGSEVHLLQALSGG